MIIIPKENCRLGQLPSWMIAPQAITPWMITPRIIALRIIVPGENCPLDNYHLSDCPRIISLRIIALEEYCPGHLHPEYMPLRIIAPRVIVARASARTAKVSSIPLSEITTTSTHFLPAKNACIYICDSTNFAV